MARASEYSRYKLCVCSHMRLVCYTTGREFTYGSVDREPHGPGWYHISPDGTLENFGQPCQAGIFRFDFEWPASCTTLDNALIEHGHPEPTPSTQTLQEKYPRCSRGTSRCTYEHTADDPRACYGPNAPRHSEMGD